MGARGFTIVGVLGVRNSSTVFINGFLGGASEAPCWKAVNGLVVDQP